MIFKVAPPFERSTCFYPTSNRNFERSQYKTKTFFKKLEYRFLLEITKIETESCQKPMLGQIEWGVQNGSIKNNGVLPVTAFWKFCYSLRTSYKELIWGTNNPNVQFILFVSTGVLFKGAFSLWVFLIRVSTFFSETMSLSFQTIVYRNAWLGKTMIIFAIKQICWK